MALLGTCDFSNAEEMTLEMATKDSVDSLPPTHESVTRRKREDRCGLVYLLRLLHCPI